MNDLRNYTLYRFEDGRRTELVAGPEPCSLLNIAEAAKSRGMQCELVSPDGEVVWPEDGAEPFLERSRR